MAEKFWFFQKDHPGYLRVLLREGPNTTAMLQIAQVRLGIYREELDFDAIKARYPEFAEDEWPDPRLFNLLWPDIKNDMLIDLERTDAVSATKSQAGKFGAEVKKAKKALAENDGSSEDHSINTTKALADELSSRSHIIQNICNILQTIAKSIRAKIIITIDEIDDLEAIIESNNVDFDQWNIALALYRDNANQPKHVLTLRKWLDWKMYLAKDKNEYFMRRMYKGHIPGYDEPESTGNHYDTDGCEEFS